MTDKEFRDTQHRDHLHQFLTSPTGVQLLSILERSARPNAKAREGYGDHEDVKFQMAANLIASMERFAFIDFIRKLAEPNPVSNRPTLEPLEEDNAYFQPTKKTSKKK